MMRQNNGFLYVRNVAIGFQQIMPTIVMAEPGNQKNVVSQINPIDVKIETRGENITLNKIFSLQCSYLFKNPCN